LVEAFVVEADTTFDANVYVNASTNKIQGVVKNLNVDLKLASTNIGPVSLILAQAALSAAIKISVIPKIQRLSLFNSQSIFF
jgi:hypothetical protein